MFLYICGWKKKIIYIDVDKLIKIWKYNNIIYFLWLKNIPFSNNIKFSPNDIKEPEEDISKRLIETPPEKLLGDELINVNENQTKVIDQETIEQENFNAASEVVPEIEVPEVAETEPVDISTEELRESPLGVTLDSLVKDIDLKSDIYKPDQFKFEAESVEQSAFPSEVSDEEELMDKMEIGLGYSLKVWNNLYVEPNYTMSAKTDEWKLYLVGSVSKTLGS